MRMIYMEGVRASEVNGEAQYRVDLSACLRACVCAVCDKVIIDNDQLDSLYFLFLEWRIDCRWFKRVS